MAGMPLHDLALALCIFLGAALYSSVGHAGASAYIALMALFGVPAAVMRPTALALNVIVASFGSFRYLRAGLFRWRILWPFLLTAVPGAFVGGMIHLPPEVYRPVVGVVLWLSAVRLFWQGPQEQRAEPSDPPIVLALAGGALIGLLSGMTGTGGGIFLSPLLLLMNWSPVKTASGVVSVFILANSVSGLLGNASSVQNLPAQLPLFAGAALLGALIGTTAGIRLHSRAISVLLGVVLIVAGAKMIGVY